MEIEYCGQSEKKSSQTLGNGYRRGKSEPQVKVWEYSGFMWNTFTLNDSRSVFWVVRCICLKITKVKHGWS